MATQVEVPAMGESITEAIVVQWLKGEGAPVAVDEPICELETDKATFDLPAPTGGVLHHVKEAGDTVHVGEVIAQIDPSATPARPAEKALPPPQASAPSRPQVAALLPPEPVGAKAPPAKPAGEVMLQIAERTPPARTADGARTPSAAPQPDAQRPKPTAGQLTPDADGIRRVPMSKIRRRIAERLVQAQQTAAMLTTFNEIDMTAVLELRARHQERFREIHGVPLGLMSFFVHACVLALKQFPALNAEIEGNDIVYHEHVHLAIAVSTDRGLVVPVLRNTEKMSFARIEAEIKRIADAAREGKLALEELSGGTFTITNGGVFGSLLSTPIVNPPQTGILGMHAIQKRPVAVQDRVEIRPMMYVALTYDHRLVDGRDSVLFLVRMKELLEDPTGMLLEA